MQHDDKSCPKSTSVSDNIDSVGSTIKSKSNPANGTPLNTSSPCTTQPKTDVISSPTCVVESTKRQQKQQFKSFNFTPIERNPKAKHDSINNSKVNSPTSPGAKQQQPYLTNTDVSNQILARSITLPAPNKTTNQCTSKTLSLITRNLVDQQVLTKLNANNRNSCTSSAVAKLTYVPSGREIVTSNKRVNFDLSKSEDKNRNLLSRPSCSKNTISSKITNQALIKRKSEVSSKYKSIVFNGTYPIDMPLKSRFDAIIEDIDPEAPKTDLYNDYDEDEDDDDDDEDDEDDYDDDDGEYDLEDEEYDENKHTAWTMQELYNDPSIPLNYKKMCSDVECSLTNFERFLDSKSVVREKAVRTFDIDGPIVEEKKKL